MTRLMTLGGARGTVATVVLRPHGSWVRRGLYPASWLHCAVRAPSRCCSAVQVASGCRLVHIRVPSHYQDDSRTPLCRPDAVWTAFRCRSADLAAPGTCRRPHAVRATSHCRHACLSASQCRRAIRDQSYCYNDAINTSMLWIDQLYRSFPQH